MLGEGSIAETALAEAPDGLSVAAARGVFAVAGAADLLAERLLAAAKGTFSLSGIASDLARTRVLDAEVGGFALTGIATLETDPAAFADPGAYTLSGQSADLLADHILAAIKGGFVLSGKAATLARTREIAADKGAFFLSGRNVEFLIGTDKLDIITTMQVRESTFRLDYAQELEEMGSGATRGADLRPELWTARLVSPVMDHDDGSGLEALLERLDNVTGTFHVWNPKRQYPQADPDGAILGSAVITITDVDGGQFLRLGGLPVGYTLTRGDFIHFDVGSPAIRSFHRIVDTISADGTGQTPVFRVRPHLLAGTTAGLVATLIRPAVEMHLAPDAMQSAQISTLYDEVSFEAVQVLP